MFSVERIRAKYAQLRDVMDERVTRLWAASEAEALGHGREDMAAVLRAFEARGDTDPPGRSAR